MQKQSKINKCRAAMISWSKENPSLVSASPLWGFAAFLIFK